MGDRPKRLAMVASKGTLDMAYPPLILATTAASMGWETGIFFTFYGLDLLHKERIKHLQVSPIGNPAMPPPLPAIPALKVPNILGTLPGMTAMATMMMQGWMAKAKMPTVQEMLLPARPAPWDVNEAQSSAVSEYWQAAPVITRAVVL